MKNVEWSSPYELLYDNFTVNVPIPKPAKNYMPDFYKKIPKFKNNDKTPKEKNNEFNNNLSFNLTAKSCIPFLDTFTTGYIQETWCDIYIRKEDGLVKYNYSWNKPGPMSHREEVFSNYFKEQDYFYDLEFLWIQPWFPKLPKGYSMLYTHPLNRLDLPFFSFSGIIDNDIYNFEETPGNYPFFIKKDFEGLIPCGTPMFQMIPIKRDGWISKKGNKLPILSSPRKYFYDGYKKLYWQKKEYL